MTPMAPVVVVKDMGLLRMTLMVLKVVPVDMDPTTTLVMGEVETIAVAAANPILMAQATAITTRTVPVTVTLLTLATLMGLVAVAVDMDPPTTIRTLPRVVLEDTDPLIMTPVTGEAVTETTITATSPPMALPTRIRMVPTIETLPTSPRASPTRTDPATVTRRTLTDPGTLIHSALTKTRAHMDPLETLTTRTPTPAQTPATNLTCLTKVLVLLLRKLGSTLAMKLLTRLVMVSRSSSPVFQGISFIIQRGEKRIALGLCIN